MDGIKKDAQNLPLVLLVENDKASVDVTRYFLKQICNIDVAENSETALALVRQNVYSLILMDINLGESMSGLDVAGEIRKLDSYKNTAIVALTAYAGPNDRDNILAAGLTYYLAKPFDKTTIINLVRCILDDAGNA